MTDEGIKYQKVKEEQDKIAEEEIKAAAELAAANKEK